MRIFKPKQKSTQLTLQNWHNVECATAGLDTEASTTDDEYLCLKDVDGCELELPKRHWVHWDKPWEVTYHSMLHAATHQIKMHYITAQHIILQYFTAQHSI